jgi:RNA exonuclease 4
MDVNNLSSNWKKLQETLKKQSASSASKKRKTSDRETQNVTTKKQKTETIERKKSSLKNVRGTRAWRGQERTGICGENYFPQKLYGYDLRALAD